MPTRALVVPQGPIITTAPDLDRACASSMLPPLPSSSRTRHPRATLTIPSSSATARQQYSTAMMGRPHGIVTDLAAFMHRADESPSNRSLAILGTTNGSIQSSDASDGAYKLGFREQPVVFDQETMLARPDSALSGSVLSSRESALTGTRPGPALDKGYIGRQMAAGMQPQVLDESQHAIDAAHASMLLSREVMSHSRTTSSPSRIVESGEDIGKVCTSLSLTCMLGAVLCSDVAHTTIDALFF